MALLLSLVLLTGVIIMMYFLQAGYNMAYINICLLEHITNWHSFYFDYTMKQPSVDHSAIVNIDYEARDIPSAAKEFKPVVFHDGDAFCCMLGPDPQAGIFGCGRTPEEAVRDWDLHFGERLAKPYENDELVKYIEEKRTKYKNSGE
jgi:hypothetical protein